MATKERSDNNLAKEWKLETWKTLKAWQKSDKKAANEEALMKNGRNFIKLFHDHEVLSDEDVESFAAFLLDQKAEPATRKIWDKTFFKYVDYWGFKSYLLKNDMKKVTGFAKLPDETVSRMLVSWKTVLQISGPIHEESSLVKLWMAFSEVMVNNTLPQNPREIWEEGLLKIWPHFSWNIRDKIHKNNLMKLSVQPGFLTIHRKLRVIILWCSGRARNDNHHKWKVIDYTQTFGAALDTVLGLEGDEITDILARDLISIATFIIGHLSNFTNLSIDEFPKLSKPVEKDNFILVAPSLAKNIIRIICMMTSRYENVDKTLQISAAELMSLKNIIREMVAAFLLRLGECELEAVTSLSRLGEFIADQGTQEHVWIVRQMIKHVPGAIMRHRVVSDDAKEGGTSIAGKLLKIMIKRSQVEEADELAIVIREGANHLPALEEVDAILEEENERPASKAAKTKSRIKNLFCFPV